jgi:hypothetical protein
MGMGWHVVLRQEVPGAAAVAMDGKGLIYRQKDLEQLARQLQLPPLTEFVSVDPESLGRYLRDQGLDPDDYPIPEEEWFAAAGALPTVRGLLAHLQAAPDAVLDSFRIVRDLQAMEKILALAENAGVEFHLVSQMPTLL